MNKLPDDLRALAASDQTPASNVLSGYVLYPGAGGGFSALRLGELAAQGWIEKRVSAYDDEDEEIVLVEQDEGGVWWDEDGNQVPDKFVITAWVTTDQTRDACETDPELSRSRINQYLQKDARDLAAHQARASSAGLELEAARFELAHAALTARLPIDLIKSYTRQLARKER